MNATSGQKFVQHKAAMPPSELALASTVDDKLGISIAGLFAASAALSPSDAITRALPPSELLVNPLWAILPSELMSIPVLNDKLGDTMMNYSQRAAVLPYCNSLRFNERGNAAYRILLNYNQGER